MPSNSEGRGRKASKHTIVTSADAQMAAEPVHNLGGCLEGSNEEMELIALVFAREVWEAKTSGGVQSLSGDPRQLLANSLTPA